MTINSHNQACKEFDEIIGEMGVKTIFDRFLDQQPPCPVGEKRLCCKFCSLGPCRMIEGVERSICGVDKHTVVMWNYARNIAAGVSCHAWHAYYYLGLLKQTAEGKTQFEIKGKDVVRDIAEFLGIGTDNKSIEEITIELTEVFANELTGPLDKKESWILRRLVPPDLLKTWSKYDVLPTSSIPEITRTLTRASIGVESDPVKIGLQTIRLGVSDLINEYICTATHNIMHGNFQPQRSVANFGALEMGSVNIVVSGHVPIMPTVIAELANDKKLNEEAKKVGAERINVVALCCTGNEIFGRSGIPLIGNFSEQELILLTGAVEAYVVEQQCVMASLGYLKEYVHTLLITTDPIANIPGAESMPVEFDKAYDQGRIIIKQAIDNFKNRDKEEITIPKSIHPIEGAFNLESFLKQIGGVDSLISAIRSGNLRGIVGMGACTNPRIKHNYGIATLGQELIKNDILILTTGCAASGLASSGLMSKEALYLAGEGLKIFCEEHKLPPTLMFGSCVYNSLLFHFCGQLAQALSCTIHDLPLAVSAPEWMNEKLFGVVTYFLVAGTFVHLGPPPPIMGSDKAISIFTNDINALFGGTLLIEPDPHKASKEILYYINKKRAALLYERN
jgi:carbon-monoxide dehydrogenase catalytic subunit